MVVEYYEVIVTSSSTPAMVLCLLTDDVDENKCEKLVFEIISHPHIYCDAIFH